MQFQSPTPFVLRFLICWVIRHLCLLRGNSLLEVEYHPVCAVAVEIVAMQAFRPQKSQSFVEFEGRYVVNFGFQCDLSLSQYVAVRL